MMLVWHRLNSSGTQYETQGIIEDSYSVIWTERWQDYGEAQVDLPPTYGITVGDLITMPERDMVVEVVGRTETEKGVQLRCRDALSVLDRRIVYPTVSNNGQVSTFVQKLLANDRIVTDGSTHGGRTLRPMRVGDLSAISARATLQRSYSQMGESMLELGRTYGFDPTCRLSGGLLYIGARANSVQRVWGIGRYLSGYTEDVDISDAKNVAYVAGQTYGGVRTTVVAGDGGASNLDRREMYVDRRDIATDGLTLEEAVELYGEPAAGMYAVLHFYRWDDGDPDMPPDEEAGQVRDIVLESLLSFDDAGGTVEIALREANPELFETLKTDYAPNIWNDDVEYDGETRLDADGNLYWHFDMTIYWHPDQPPIQKTLDLPGDEVFPYTTITIYANPILGPIGEEALAGLQPETAFEAATEGLTPYVDYGLGDAVAVFKADGSRKDMRVVEVVESWDSQGYKATPGLASL